MSRVAGSVLSGVMVALAVVMGLGIPVLTLHYMTEGLNPIAGVFVILIFVIGGVCLGVVSAALSFAGPFTNRFRFSEDEERLKVLRASHQALLEEMDEQLAVLKEIREALQRPDEARA